MNLEIPVEQFHEALDEVVDELLREAEIERPPVNAAVVARRLGLVVAAAGPGAERARFRRVGPLRLPVIYLADERRQERRHWAVAHELGEWAAHRVFRRLGTAWVDLPPASREAAANRFAGRLLLPRQWFASIGADCGWDLLDLKQSFPTASHELIARRQLDFTRPVLVSVFDHQRLTWRASNLPWSTPPLARCEIDVHRALVQRREPVQADPRALPVEIADVRGWPVDEPGWQRDILCTELATRFD